MPLAGTRQLPALTGLRGAAALWVAGVHVRLFVPALDSSVLRLGYAGVDVFFVLSGFIIAYVHLEEFRDFSRRRFLDFLGLRFARIYPVHLVALLGAIVFALLLAAIGKNLAADPRFGLDVLVGSLLMIQAWGWVHHTSWNMPAWSISAEWLAYLAFPLLAGIMVRLGRPRAALVSLACAAGYAIFAGYAQRRDLDLIGPWAPLRIGLQFIAGMGAYRVWQAVEGRPPAAGWLADLAGLVMLIGVYEESYAIAVLPIVVLVPALGCGQGLIARVLQTRACKRLGEVSYSFYMVHLLILEIAFMPLSYTRLGRLGTVPRLGILAVAFVAIAVATSAMYRFVEVPARTWLRALLTDGASRARVVPSTR